MEAGDVSRTTSFIFWDVIQLNVGKRYIYFDCKTFISYQHHHLPTPSPPTHPPIKTAGCSNARSTPPRISGAVGRFGVSYPLHGRQRTDKNVCRRPAYSIRASEGRRLRASPRYSPVSSLPHPLPPSAVGAARCVKLERGKHRQHPVELFTIRLKVGLGSQRRRRKRFFRG